MIHRKLIRVLQRTLRNRNCYKIFNIFFVFYFQKYLNGRSEVEIGYLTTSKTGGATPLVIACRNGHYDIAYYLLHNIGVDCEQTGSVTFDGETIESAPPLW